jgi:hypothetical protein
MIVISISFIDFNNKDLIRVENETISSIDDVFFENEYPSRYLTVHSL